MTAYATAVGRWERLTAPAADPAVNPDAASITLLRGRPTERAYLLLHGTTNSRAQCRAVARRLHDKGANVVVPRLPRHGLRDRMTAEIGRLDPDELLEAAAAAIAVAAGLGASTTVAGLSLGGVLAALLAERRDDIDLAVLVAPLFGIRRVPNLLLPAITLAARRGPEVWFWWDRTWRAALEPTYGYPRCSSRAFGTLLELGRRAQRAADRGLKARAVLLVTNAADPAVDNRPTWRLADRWAAAGGDVTRFEFPAAENLPHDLVDPGHRAARTEAVYPVLLDLMSRAEAGTPAGTARP